MTVIFLTFLGCAPKDVQLTPGYIQPGGPVVGTVNGQPITQAVLDAELSQLPPELRAQLEMPGQTQDTQEKLFLKEALYQAALAENVLKDDELRIRIAIATRDAMIEALLMQVAEDGTSEAMLNRWYDDKIDQFAVSQASASHILTETEEEALSVKEQLLGGADFADVARAQSIDPSAITNGGELGWFSDVQMVPSFSEAVFAAEAGTTVGPIQSQFGWHVIRIDAFRDAIPLDDVKDEVRNIVQEEVVNEYIETIQAAAFESESETETETPSESETETQPESETETQPEPD